MTSYGGWIPHRSYLFGKYYHKHYSRVWTKTHGLNRRPYWDLWTDVMMDYFPMYWTLIQFYVWREHQQFVNNFMAIIILFFDKIDSDCRFMEYYLICFLVMCSLSSMCSYIYSSLWYSWQYQFCMKLSNRSPRCVFVKVTQYVQCRLALFLPQVLKVWNTVFKKLLGKSTTVVLDFLPNIGLMQKVRMIRNRKMQGIFILLFVSLHWGLKKWLTFADDIFKWIFLIKSCYILIKISQRYGLKDSRIHW